MSDPISRSDAIGAKPEYRNEDMLDKEKSTYNKGWNDCNDAWVAIIKALPSAEPPTGELISKADAIELLTKIVFDEPPYLDSETLCRKYAEEQINSLPSAEAVSREDYHNLLTASEDIDRALREYQAKEEQLSAEAKGDLISRQDAVNTIKRYKHRLQGKGQTYGFLLEEFEHQIPSAEAVQGEWGHMIADGSDGSHWYEYECSHCGEVVLRPYNFCPNCGAKMFREDGEA